MVIVANLAGTTDVYVMDRPLLERALQNLLRSSSACTRMAMMASNEVNE